MADAIETLAAASCGAEKSAPSIGSRGVGVGGCWFGPYLLFTRSLSNGLRE